MFCLIVFRTVMSHINQAENQFCLRQPRKPAPLTSPLEGKDAALPASRRAAPAAATATPASETAAAEPSAAPGPPASSATHLREEENQEALAGMGDEENKRD